MNSIVELYGKATCGYCLRAKALLKRRGIAFSEVDVEKDVCGMDHLLARKPDAKTVPQIFIDGRSIGGYDDLKALDEAGGLQTLRAA
ncbi:MAG: glutaredoxin domain-containing protein [Rhodospirillales bacterium]